jgi:hypothetical protein
VASARAGGGDRAPSGRRHRHAFATRRAASAAVGTARERLREEGGRAGVGRAVELLRARTRTGEAGPLWPAGQKGSGGLLL